MGSFAHGIFAAPIATTSPKAVSMLVTSSHLFCGMMTLQLLRTKREFRKLMGCLWKCCSRGWPLSDDRAWMARKLRYSRLSIYTHFLT